MRRRSIIVTALALVVLAAPVASAQDRVKSKEVVIGLGAEPRTMLAVTIVDWTTNNMLEHMYDRLLDRDAKTLKPKPMLATSWKVVNDTTWEFALRKGVKFHNGEPFTAASVKATFDYMLDPATKSHYATAAYWKPLKEVQIVDDYTVRLVTDKPYPSLLDHAALTDLLLMPAKALKELGPQKLAEKPIGTGPFRFVEWKRDERLVLDRNPDYWQGPADVSRVTFRFIPEFSARMAALLSGEIDIMKDVPPQAVEAVERSGRAKVRSTVSSRINYLALVNLKPGPMQDVR
jgi:peptide/nickel transport system substrate-binding protein